MSRASDNVLEYLRKAMREQRNEYTDHVAGGACKEYSEYTKSCGIIEGLAIAERELLDLQKRIEED